MTDKSALGYLAKVKRALPRDEQRAHHMAQATALAENYLEENPNAQGTDLEAAFGAPADFAAEMVGPDGIARARKQRKRLCFAIVGLVLAALLVVATVFFVRWQSLRKIIPEDGNFDIIYPAVTLSPEEYDALWNDPNATKDGERFE